MAANWNWLRELTSSKAIKQLNDFLKKVEAHVNDLPGSGSVAAGGTAGQIYEKVDGTDYNATWVNNTAVKTGITDAGGYYVGENVELALQEVGEATGVDDSSHITVDGIGDGSDESVAVQAAIDSGARKVFFPPGTWSFKDVTVPANVELDGCGWARLTPLSINAQTNQPSTMFAFTNDLVVIRNFRIIADNSNGNTGGSAAATQSIFDFDTVDNVLIDGCYFSGFDGSNRLSAPVNWYERKGLLFTFLDCGDVFFNNCEFTAIGGDEWVWRIYNAKTYSYGKTIIKDCYVRDADGSALTGAYNKTYSCFGLFGGSISIRNNKFENYNYFTGTTGGTMVNCAGPYVYIDKNTVTGANCGALFDTCEGYTCKNEEVHFTDNFCINNAVDADDDRGEILQCLPRKLFFTGNDVYGRCGVQHLWNTSTLPTRYADIATYDLCELVHIEGNYFNDFDATTDPDAVSGNAASYVYTRSQIYLARAATAATDLIDTVRIINNTFKAEGTNGYAPIRTACLSDNLEIGNNTFKTIGKTSSASYFAAIVLPSTVLTSTYAKIFGNTIANENSQSVTTAYLVANTGSANTFQMHFMDNVSQTTCGLNYGGATTSRVNNRNFTGVNAIDADDVSIADAGDIITATDVEGALQENRTAIDLNTTHRGLTTGNPHSVSKSDVGLGNADNTSDANKPVSTAQQTALDGKVDANAAITGATKTKIIYDAKGLVTGGADATTADIADSTDRRYMTDAQESKLDGIEAGAEVNNISDVNATDLTDGGDTTLHDHDGISENTAHRGLTNNPHTVTPAQLGLVIGTNVLAQQTIGIADNNLLEVDGSPNDNEYARFTANGLEGVSLTALKAALVVSDSGGTNVSSFSNSWDNYDTVNYQRARYRKIGNVVYVEGLIKSGTAATAFTLPAGYRPANRIVFACYASGGANRVDVLTSGAVVVYSFGDSFSSVMLSFSVV